MNYRRASCASGSSAETSSNRLEDPAPRPPRKEVVVPTQSSFDVPTLQRRTLRNQVMTRRRVETPDLFRMAIHTREAAILIDRDQLFAQILPQAIFVMTLGAGCDRHIRF